MAKRRNDRTEGSEQNLHDPYYYRPIATEYGIPGFAERKARPGQPPAREERGAPPTERQLALRELILSGPVDQIEANFDSGDYTLTDALDVVLKSLEWSNAVADEIIAESATSRRRFDKRAQKIDAQLDEIDRKLAELVGDGR
jgi:hypothetical protein